MNLLKKDEDIIFLNHTSESIYKSNKTSSVSSSNPNKILSLYAIDTLSILLGSIDSVFGNSNKVEAPALSNSAILLVGESGCGCSTLVVEAISAYYPNLQFVDFSIGTSLIARAKLSNRLSYIDWIKQEWCRILLLATSYKKCVLMLSDLHALTPRILMNDYNIPETEEIIEMIFQSLTTIISHNETLGCNKLLIIGRTYAEGLIDEKILGIWKEKILFLPPNAKERRRIFRYIWNNSDFKDTCHSYEDYDIDSVADNCKPLPLINLIDKAKRLIQSRIKHSTTLQKPMNKNDYKINLFSKVAGHFSIKQTLIESVLWPRYYGPLYLAYMNNNATSNCSDRNMGTISPVGILLFGPPGTGKTMLPRELANKIGINIINLGLADVIRGEVGAGELRVNEIFTEAKRAAPSVIFIDEFQAIFTTQEDTHNNEVGATLSSTLAGCFDDINTWNKYAGHESLVTIIASTNEPWAIDGSFLRPNRLEKCIFVGPLDYNGRVDFLRNTNLSAILDEEHIKLIASLTDRFTGADMSLLIRKLEDAFTYIDISFDTILTVTKSISPSVSKLEVKEYIDWQQNSHIY